MASRKPRLTWKHRLCSVRLSIHKLLPSDLFEPQNVRNRRVFEYLSQQFERKLLSDVRHRSGCGNSNAKV
jgi:hypothetical protein